MEGYLGEFPVDIAQSEFDGWWPQDWAMYFIGRYGQIDGDHHKAWVLDQVARILKGSPVRVVEAKWESGESEYRVTVERASAVYEEWVADGFGDADYNEGIAP
jgi:hypothetical protein